VFRLNSVPVHCPPCCFTHWLLFVIYLMKSLPPEVRKSLPSEVIICPFWGNRPRYLRQNAPFKPFPVQIPINSFTFSFVR
jgi:hypothetical protein